MPRLRPLSLAILFALPSAALADEAGQDRHGHAPPKTLEAVEVKATPLGTAIDDLARPVELLLGTELDERKAGTLGATLAGESGVQSSFFGAGVGRPIIRGQEGARVQVLSGGTGSMDASTLSADHAVAIEPFLADQIEVLKGPASLLYGSGAIGGAVNVVDGRIPTAPIGKPLSGRAEFSHGRGNGELTGLVRLDGDQGRWSWHVDGFHRDAEDYAIPGYAFSPRLLAEALAEGEDPAHLARGELPNSALRTHGAGAGASWFGDAFWAGASLSRYASNYGIPPGAHEHHDEDESDGHEGDAEEDAETVRIDLVQDRFDSRGGWRELGPLQELNWRYTRNDYRHLEMEGAALGTRFDNRASELRLEAVQSEFAGWNGAFGLQRGERDFRAIGDEAFVPATRSRDLGLFALQEREFGRLKIEAGARHERVSVALDDGSDRQQRRANSLSFAGLWKANDAVHLSLGLDRAQRAPSAEELYSDGPHVATGGYEVGDRALRSETSRSAELGLHLHAGRFSGEFAVYRTRFDDYLHLGETGVEIDGLPLRQWRQADARFKGWEASGDFELADTDSGRWTLGFLLDRVSARLDSGDALPRIAPARAGLNINWERGGWRGRLGAVRVATQDEVAAFETATPGYTLLDAHLSYHWDGPRAGWEVFADARNLGDREARAHTSFLKDVAPLPGRAVHVGLRVLF